jgi:hypothetical protein
MTTKEREKIYSWNNLQLKRRNKILVFGNNYNQRGNGELRRETNHDYKRRKKNYVHGTIYNKEQIISVWEQLQPEREWRITPRNKS